MVCERFFYPVHLHYNELINQVFRLARATAKLSFCSTNNTGRGVGKMAMTRTPLRYEKLAQKIVVARGRFELPSMAPKATMLVHYTTGLHDFVWAETRFALFLWF